MTAICAGIVLYEPDITLLQQNLAAIAPQVQAIILVDNASQNLEQVRAALADVDVTWIVNKTNGGIAKALNQMMVAAAGMGFDWMVTLDQDSLSDAAMVANMTPAMADGVIMVAPRVIDMAFAPSVKEDSAEDFEDIDRCITSGALTRVSAVTSIGGFDERLFIDQVDNEICLRAVSRGYRIVRSNHALLHQRYGESGVRRRVLWRVVSYHMYSPMRVYYQQRNLIYMCKKFGTAYVPHPVFFALIRQPAAFVLKVIFQPEQRNERVKQFLRGFKDGIMMSTKTPGA